MLEWFSDLKITNEIITTYINISAAEFFTTYHLILSVFILVLGLGIFFRAIKFYFESKDSKTLILGIGFLFGGLTYLLHALYWHMYGITFNITYKMVGYLYLIILQLFLSISVLISAFYISDSSKITKHNFMRNSFVIPTLVFSLTTVLIELYRQLSPVSLDFNINKYILTNPSILILNSILFILSTLIYGNIRYSNNQKIFSPFILGFLILSIGESYLLSLMGNEILFLMLLHIGIVIAFAMILIGLKDFYQTSGLFGFRLKMVVFPAVILMLFYTIFTTLNKTLFNVNIPLMSQYVFWVLFIGTIVLEYWITAKLYKPIANLIQATKNLKPNQKPEKIPVISKDELGLLTAEFNKNAELIWQNTERETIIRRISDTIRSTLDIDQVLKLICKEIGKTFNVQRVSISQYPQNIIRSEYRARDDIKGLEHMDFGKDVATFWGQALESGFDYIAVDNVEQANIPDFLKKFYKSIDTRSFIGIPVKNAHEKWGGLVLAQTDNYRHWTQEEIELLKIISSQIYSAIKQAELYTSTKNFADREALLRGIINNIRGSLDIGEIKQSIVNEVGKLFNADRCFITPAGEKGFLTIDVEYLSSNNIKSLKGYILPDEVNKHYLSINIKNKPEFLSEIEAIPEDSSLNIAIKEYSRKLDIKSNYRFPIFIDDRLIRVLVIQFTKKQVSLNNNDIELLKAVASQAGIAMKQAELYSSTKSYAERENLLRTIISNTLLSANREEAIKNITAEVGKLFNADRACFMFFDNNLKTFSEIRGEYRKREDMPSTEGKVLLRRDTERYLMEELFDKKNTLVFYENEGTKFPEGFIDFIKSLDIKSAVAAPVFYKDKPIGTILITNTESVRRWSKEELDFLVPILQQISIGLNIFQLNTQLCNTLNREINVKDIVLKARELNDYRKIWDYLLDRLTNMYGVDRALNLNFTPEGKLCICNEVIKNIDPKYSLGQDISNVKNTLEILPNETDKIVVVNDIDSDINDSVLKEYFRSKKAHALLLYLVASTHLPIQQIQGIIMLCSSVPRKWTSDEIDSLKLVVDTTTLVYLEIKQRQEAEEQRKTFLATLTHDLRSPLNAEQKALEAILAKKLGTSLENFSEFLEDMHKTNEELLRIVNNLLMTYHYESGKTELMMEANNIKDIVYNAVNSMKPLAKDNHSEIITEIQPDLPLVMVNSDEITRVIINLINNAIKHNKQGTNVNIIVRKINSEIQVSVSDKGKGISEAERPNIFQRYPTTKRKIGTGLGLYLSKQIITAHHGKIWFDTEINKGTTFYFTLPIA